MSKQEEAWTWPWLVLGLVVFAVFVVFTIIWMKGA